ncbi:MULTISPECIES: DUF6745 domain-containing protein [Streptomyces]|uniref:DUF6745 domain-containing protein n=1 Tax=Streptomyces griseus subsp. griseus (strain JCM 4626 / CBS 651.72 / NBRC 13350 / KCC S-0626 / ISP 5235) TaxID=455632 RepID=B1VT71_STRGG|nr:hypothetical protein [Streptomyces griseus]MYR15123.1 hypothetical protein [Streptomyces sp. SID724]MBW3703430.1 hypothetical protein [Streptomyces griseus]NEB55265.1 hypothetical protein [Streptomyces griseus]SED66237.1 hypothetical protein SAMN04490359_1317 [Streptomyces griseus]SQA24254.1 Uncharacterised protein [Streptomyces griseus]
MQNVNSWRSVAAATGRADRAAAEAGVRRAYRTAGLAEPDRIIWAASPRAAVETVEKLADAGRSVREEVRTRPWAEERRRMYDELGPAGWAALWSATGAQLWETTGALAERIRTGVVADLAPRPGDESAVRLVLLDAVLGQHDAAWLAAFDGRGERLRGLAEVARNAGWWWPYEHAVVITERPDVLHRDEAGRLDHGEGPALAYGDGFALHAWRGMPVPAAFLDELSSLTPERIRAEENAELRRVMLEYYGYDRYLTESGAEPVHRDETGILWRIALAGDEDVVMVEVVNSTPEPDGTYRTYWLRVPPATRTAKDGVAWTFGLDGAAYAPVRQT